MSILLPYLTFCPGIMTARKGWTTMGNQTAGRSNSWYCGVSRVMTTHKSALEAMVILDVSGKNQESSDETRAGGNDYLMCNQSKSCHPIAKQGSCPIRPNTYMEVPRRKKVLTVSWSKSIDYLNHKTRVRPKLRVFELDSTYIEEAWNMAQVGVVL